MFALLAFLVHVPSGQASRLATMLPLTLAPLPRALPAQWWGRDECGDIVIYLPCDCEHPVKKKEWKHKPDRIKCDWEDPKWKPDRCPDRCPGDWPHHDGGHDWEDDWREEDWGVCPPWLWPEVRARGRGGACVWHGMCARGRLRHLPGSAAARAKEPAAQPSCQPPPPCAPPPPPAVVPRVALVLPRLARLQRRLPRAPAPDLLLRRALLPALELHPRPAAAAPLPGLLLGQPRLRPALPAGAPRAPDVLPVGPRLLPALRGRAAAPAPGLLPLERRLLALVPGRPRLRSQPRPGRLPLPGRHQLLLRRPL